MPTPLPAPPQTPLAQISREAKQAVVRRVVRTAPVVAPLDVAAFSSAI